MKSRLRRRLHTNLIMELLVYYLLCPCINCMFQYTNNAPISAEIANKLREEIEDEKKSKRFLEKNMEDLKLKLEMMKSDGIEKLQVNNKHLNTNI